MKTVMDWMNEAMERNRQARGNPQFPQRGRTIVPNPETTFPPDIATAPKGLDDALRGLADKPFLNSRRYQEQQWRANREGAHPKILLFEKTFVSRMAKHNVPVYAHCVVRTEEEQRKLFLDGFSKDSPEDGLWPHNGTAVDLIHSIKGWNLTPLEWRVFGHVGHEVAQQCGIVRNHEWGGDWSFYDPAHWQLKNWAQQQEQPEWT